MNLRITFLSILFVLFISSCVTPKDTNLLQDINKNYPEAANLINSDYKLIPGDKLILTIYTLNEDMKDLFSMYIGNQTGTSSNNSSITGSGSDNKLAKNTLNIYSDGTVNIPYIGKIYVEGLTILEAKKMIENKFQEFSPNLTIELNLQNRFFSVLGQASRGRFTMPSQKITIFQALALSGPINTFGNRSHVKIIRQTPNGTEVKSFDIRSKDIVNSEYYYIQPNDVIYVDQMSRTFFGKVTSFTGALGLFSIVTSVVAAVFLIINLTK